MLQLVVENGQPLGQSWPLPERATAIGRGAECDIVLTGPQVSRTHCVIEWRGGGYALSDKSTNGTLVNGRRAQGQVMLKPGDRIQVGDTVLRVDQAGDLSPASAMPPASPAYAPYPAVDALSDPGLASPQPGVQAPVYMPPPRPRPQQKSNVIPVTIGVIAAILILATVIAAPILLSRPQGKTSAPTVGAPNEAPVDLTPTGAPEVTATAAPADQPTAEPTVAAAVDGQVTAATNLRVRNSASQSGAQLYSLPPGSALKVLGRNEAGDWYAIQCAEGQPAGTVCWVSAQYVKLTPPDAQLPLVQP